MGSVKKKMSLQGSNRPFAIHSSGSKTNLRKHSSSGNAYPYPDMSPAERTKTPVFSVSASDLQDKPAGRKRVTLNISGLKYEACIATLNQFPDTLLGDPMRRLEFYDSEHNDYFFERDRSSFDAILSFYQTGQLRRPLDVPLDVFVEEIKYFDLGQDVLLKFREDEGYVEEKNDENPMPIGTT